jgi:hypothetical protein
MSTGVALSACVIRPSQHRGKPPPQTFSNSRTLSNLQHQLQSSTLPHLPWPHVHGRCTFLTRNSPFSTSGKDPVSSIPNLEHFQIRIVHCNLPSLSRRLSRPSQFGCSSVSHPSLGAAIRPSHTGFSTRLKLHQRCPCLSRSLYSSPFQASHRARYSLVPASQRHRGRFNILTSQLAFLRLSHLGVALLERVIRLSQHRV